MRTKLNRKGKRFFASTLTAGIVFALAFTLFTLVSCGAEAKEVTDHNMKLKHSAEAYLKRQVLTILDGVLGLNKANVKISIELDFDQISKQVESYDPTKRAVRSELHKDDEVNRTVVQMISNPSTIKRLTVLVAIDGIYESDSISGKEIYRPRGEEELTVLTQIVKNAVGYSQKRNDSVYVASVQFNRSYWEDEKEAFELYMENNRKEMELIDKAKR